MMLPEHYIFGLFNAACSADAPLRHQWKQACAAGEESIHSCKQTISAITNALALAKFVAEREDAYFRTNAESILACCNTPLRQRLANAILQFDSARTSPFNHLIEPECLQQRMGRLLKLTGHPN
jgi:hypothetical protein